LQKVQNIFLKTNMNDLNPEIFNFIRIKPLTQIMGMSQSRFTQKLRNHKIKGQVQSFTVDEQEKLKKGLGTLMDILNAEVQKVNI
jgi:hypothetical protein